MNTQSAKVPFEHERVDGAQNTSPIQLAPYASRWYRSMGIWRPGVLDLKVYRIDHRVEEPSDPQSSAIFQAARDMTGSLSDAAETEGAHNGLGYVILHCGKTANFLLLDWWAHGDICCRLLYASNLDQPTLFERVARPLSACVWETVVISHERNAWVNQMMQITPSPGGYLADVLPDGCY